MDHSAFWNEWRKNLQISGYWFPTRFRFIIKPNTNSVHKNSVNLSTNKLLEFDLILMIVQ